MSVDDDGSRRPRRARALRSSAVNTLVRFLSERGLSDEEIERALVYVEATGVYTIREAFVQAMSRTLYSDEELASGSRFQFDERLTPAE